MKHTREQWAKIIFKDPSTDTLLVVVNDILDDWEESDRLSLDIMSKLRADMACKVKEVSSLFSNPLGGSILGGDL